MKKIAATLSVLVIFTLAGCGDKSNEDDVDVNPGKGDDVCQGDSCEDEKGDDR